MQGRTWWKEAIIYQVYPRSFKDSNGDGIGDIRGIIEKLDHLSELGVDVIWLGPVYDSPNDDNGYDIRDYYKIHPEFGTMEDLDELLEELHARGMKLLMDLVVNHSSDEHKWFEASRSSKDNPYREYYFWRKGKNGGPPNNWHSFFGGSAWEYDAASDEYYLHLFTKKQPDLNWENPQVREGVYDIMNFWLEKGIDGFRMDVIPLISKRLGFEDAESEDYQDLIGNVYSNGPKVHTYIAEMVERTVANHDVMTVGEGPGINSEVGIKYVGHDRGELNMIFHLDHMFLGCGPEGKFDPKPYGLPEIKEIFNRWDKAMGDSGWLSIFMDNHDFPRMVSRFGNDQIFRVESAKLLAVMILTLRGTPCIYMGSEIGMTNVAFPFFEDFDDIETRNYVRSAKENGVSDDEILATANRYGRDNVRTPMHWDDSMHAGFTQAEPWIKVNPNYSDINVKADKASDDSIFAFYKDLISFRKKHPCFVYGKYSEIETDNPNLFCYSREDGQEHFVVCLNFSDAKQTLPVEVEGASLVLHNYAHDSGHVLMPWEARIYQFS